MDVPVIAPATTRNVWVREVTAPAGYFRLNTISTGSANTTSDNTTSRAVHGSVPSGNRPTTSRRPAPEYWRHGSRAFANGLNNPQATPKCGLNLAMVFDVSSSINTAEMAAMKNAARGFRHRPHRHAVADRDVLVRHGRARRGRSGQPAADAGRDRQRPGDERTSTACPPIPAAGATAPTGTAGLFQVAQSTSHYDVTLMLTDGNPTVWGPTGVMRPTSPAAAAVVAAGIEEAVASANAVKNKGTQISAVGIGPTNLPVDNLTAISGPGDAFTTGFDDLGDLLEALATGLCHGTVTVVKEAQAAGQTQFTPAADWTFTTSTAHGDSRQRHHRAGDRRRQFQRVDFSGSATPKSVSFQEGPQAGVEPGPAIRLQRPMYDRRWCHRRAEHEQRPDRLHAQRRSQRHHQLPGTEPAADLAAAHARQPGRQ